MAKRRKLVVVCKQCGKSAPIDYEKSRKNFTVYKTSQGCTCGGEFVTKLLEEEG